MLKSEEVAEPPCTILVTVMELVVPTNVLVIVHVTVVLPASTIVLVPAHAPLNVTLWSPGPVSLTIYVLEASPLYVVPVALPG